MTTTTPTERPPVGRAIPWLVFGLLLAYSHARFVATPYPGFRFDTSTGEVGEVYVEAPAASALRVGDRVVAIGPVGMDDFRRSLRRTVFDGVRPGATLPIRIERDGQALTVPWVYAGFNRAEFLSRLNSQWWSAYVFWLAGSLAFASLRPKDARWRLMVAFNYLTAVWLMAGSVSRFQLWESAVVLRVAVWLSVPVYLHLHWVFPRPLGRLPVLVPRLAYGAAVGLAGLQWLDWLPRDAYLLGLLIALAGSAALLGLHAALRPADRSDLRFLLIALVLSAMPAFLVGVTGLGGRVPLYAGGALITLPALPLAYLFVAARRELGGLELRANRLVTVFVFFALLLSVSTLVAAGLTAWLGLDSDFLAGSLLSTVAAGVLTLAGYAPLQRFVEDRLLGIHPPPTRMLERYAARIATRLDTAGLVGALHEQVLPGLLVRQSALLHFDAAGPARPVALLSVTPGDLPTEAQMPALLSQAGRYRSAAVTAGPGAACPWVRLVLPLRLGDRTSGVWLLGRRDPDDFYSQGEIPALQAVADQTAVALANVLQAERLRALYQADIDRHEAERAKLARDLHDETLQHLSLLLQAGGDAARRPGFEAHYRRAVESLRRTVGGLRPALLDYGLATALAGLADDLAERAGEVTRVTCEIADAGERYDRPLEQHVYRIVQQACENALRHGRPRRVCIEGRLAPDRLDLCVEDDGDGFAVGERPDLEALLARRHFGLAGMYERAVLVGAVLQLDSAPGRGTRVRVTWAARPANGAGSPEDGL